MLSKHFEEIRSKKLAELTVSNEEVYLYILECVVPETGDTTVRQDYVFDPAYVMSELEESKEIFGSYGDSYEVDVLYDPVVNPLRVGERKGCYSAILTDETGFKYYHAVYLERLK